MTRFRERLVDHPGGPSDAVAAIETLLDLIRSSKGKNSTLILLLVGLN